MMDSLLLSAFEYCDKKNLGKIPKAEVPVFLTAAGLESFPEDCERRCGTKDSFTLNDLKERFGDYFTKIEEGIIKEIFNAFDRDAKGFITARDIRNAADEVGELILDENIIELICLICNSPNGLSVLDKFDDLDCKISFEQFKTFFDNLPSK